MVKGKSMVSEEIGLNHDGPAHGVECIETDMGEYIRSSTATAPPHHRAGDPQTAKTSPRSFTSTSTACRSDDVNELIAIGRRAAREVREREDRRLGVNFMVAETGTLALVENEGNGRLCTRCRTHGRSLAREGVDRLSTCCRCTRCCRRATGRAVTTYLNLITGPRRAGEKDGCARCI